MGFVTQTTKGLEEMANLGGGDAGQTDAAVYRREAGSFGGCADAAGGWGESDGEEQGDGGQTWRRAVIWFWEELCARTGLFDVSSGSSCVQFP